MPAASNTTPEPVPENEPRPSKAASERLRELQEEGLLILPTVWDPMSASLAALHGATGVATTSGGVSWAHGRPDGERLHLDEMLGAVGRIIDSVGVPVSADIERGYGSTQETVADTVSAFIDVGVAGINIEDSLQDGTLREVDEQSERLEAARRAANACGVPLVINARTDVFLGGAFEPEAAATEVFMRADQYEEAGADGLFVPGLLDLEVLASIARSTSLPLNVMAGPGAPTVAELEEAGVRRVTLGTALAETAYTALGRALADILQHGGYDALESSLSFEGYNGLF